MGCVKGRPGAAPAGRDDRRLYQWEDFTEERQEADLPPDVAARLGPLGHDQIAARLLGRHGLGTRTDLPGDEGAARVRDLHEFRVRLLVEELDHRGPGGRHLQNLQEVGVELAGLAHPVNDEVRAERAGRRPTQAVEDLRDVLRRRGSDSTDHPGASGVRARRRQGRRGDLAHPRLLQRHRAPEQFREFRPEHHEHVSVEAYPLALLIRVGSAGPRRNPLDRPRAMRRANKLPGKAVWSASAGGTQGATESAQIGLRNSAMTARISRRKQNLTVQLPLRSSVSQGQKSAPLSLSLLSSNSLPTVEPWIPQVFIRILFSSNVLPTGAPGSPTRMPAK